MDVSRIERIRVETAGGTPGVLGSARDIGYKMASFAAAVEFLRDGDQQALYVDVQDVDGPIVWEPVGPADAPT